MPERGQPRMPAAAALVLGLGLAALTGLGGWIALAAGWLAQPALALAVRGLRGQGPADGRAWWRDVASLALLWGGGLAAAALLLAWPLSALRAGAGLGPVLALSAAAGICLIGLWRTWPLWRALEGEGGSLARQWAVLGASDAAAWRGLGAAAAIAVVLALVLFLAAPAVPVSEAARWIAAGALAVLSPLLHLLLQRLPAPRSDPRVLDLPVVEMPGFATMEAAPAEDEADLELALYAAARSGRVDRALELLEAGADVHGLPPATGPDQRSLPVLAAVLPDLRLLRALISGGVDLNQAHAGVTPLLAATRDSWHGRPDAVMTLLANGADPRAVDLEGNTPLHHAARSSDPGVAALLRDAAAEIDAINHEGLTPLGVACTVGNWRLARFLLERGARSEPEGATPVLLAAAGGEEDDPAGVALLLRHKAKVDARGRDGRSALHLAAGSGHPEIVEALLTAGADVHARDARGLTPLLEAARGGSLAVLEALLAAKADAHARATDGGTALLLAVAGERPSVELVARLQALGVDAAATDAGGRRAADLAAEAGRWALVTLLDPAYPLPASVLPESADGAPEDRTPLELMVEGLRERAFDRIAGLAQLLGARELGALLLDPDQAPDAERIEWLLAHGAEADVPDAEGRTPAFALLSAGPEAAPALRALLAHGASPAGAGGLARFLAACAGAERAARGLEPLALELVERGADFLAPADGDPPLSLAIRLDWRELLQRLLELGVDADARDARGMTALHLAAALGRPDALKALVLEGAWSEVRAADGQTPLGVALASGRRDLADWLDWRGWTPPRRRLLPADVPSAAMAGDADAVRRLLDLGFDVDAVDAQGCSALLRAAGGGHPAVVDLLLARGADPQLAAGTGATPLSAAVSMRHQEIVDRLLARGAPLEQRLPHDVTVLMLAAALGLPDMCARLLTAGANIQAADAQGLTPLHCAALYGFTSRDRARLLALFDTLLLAGAPVDAVAAGGVTPLLLLVGARAEPGTACDEDVVLAVLEYLLDEGASLEAQDPRGFGPLHLAALHGLLSITRRLLRAGADPEQRDALNRTPREIAVMRGFIDVAGEFAPVQSGVSMARFLRDRSQDPSRG